MNLADLERQLIAPLSETQPAGTNPCKHEDYLTAKILISDYKGGSPPQWARVLDMSSKLLIREGKDLDLGIYTTLALQGLYNWPGACVGIRVLTALLDAFWADLPSPEKFRGRSLDAFAGDFLKVLKRTPAIREKDRSDLVWALNALDQAVIKRIPEGGARFEGLIPILKAIPPDGTATQAPTEPSLTPTADQPVTAVETQEHAPIEPAPVERAEAVSLPAAIAPVIDEQGIASILQAIGPDGVGLNPRKDPSFALVKAEIDKKGAIGTGTPDFAVINRESVRILGQTGKDMAVMAYVAYSWVAEHKLKGLVAALELGGALLARFGKELYPKGNRLIPVFKWMEEHVGVPSLENADSVMVARTMVAREALVSLLRQHFGAEAVEFSSLGLKLTERQKELTAEKAPEPVQIAPSPEGTGDNVPQVIQEPEKVKTPASVPVDIPDLNIIGEEDTHKLFEQSRTLGTRLQQLLPQHYGGYALLRVGLYHNVKQLSHDNGKTGIPGPSKLNRESLQKMMAAGAWEALLANSEDYLIKFRYWLDVSYCAATAAKNLNLEPIEDLIVQQTLRLHRDFPELLGLSFKDGTPFAGEEAKAWIQSLVTSATGGSVRSEPLDHFREELFLQTEKQSFPTKLSWAKDQVSRCRDGLQRFAMQLEIARLCSARGHASMAIAMAQSLCEEAKLRQLDYWSPDLVAQSCKFLLENSRKSQKKGTPLREFEQEAFAYLMALAPDLAVQIDLREV